ncbi:MAG: hypothetical protein LBQ63_02835 [Deltaproteobacteria bacterium]|jgi:multidrug resistance efflux pump|nr:hypothetical protein [Deltaproteobacteria bacterium]
MDAPLSTEKNTDRKPALPKLILFPAAAGILLALLSGIVLLLPPQASRRSLRAELDGHSEELVAPINGEILFIAEPGQYIREGEILLSLDTREESLALKEAESLLEEKATALPRPYRELLSAYLFYRQEQVTEKDLLEAEEEEKKALASLQAESVRQAGLALRLRRLEMKQGKTAREMGELESLRAEEALAGTKLAESRARHEKAALTRAELGKKLARLNEIDLALRLAPPEIRESFAQLRSLRLRAQNLEERILKSEIRASRPLRVIFTFLKIGEEAAAGRPVLRAMPEDRDEISLTAYFDGKTAAKLRIGAPCRVEFGARSLKGVIRARRPYADLGPETLIPFSVGIPLPLRAEELAGIDPGESIRVFPD